jgi:hypothetical protein
LQTRELQPNPSLPPPSRLLYLQLRLSADDERGCAGMVKEDRIKAQALRNGEVGDVSGLPGGSF